MPGYRTVIIRTKKATDMNKEFDLKPTAPDKEYQRLTNKKLNNNQNRCIELQAKSNNSINDLGHTTYIPKETKERAFKVRV